MEMSPNLGVTGGKRKDAEGDGLVTTSFERGVFVYLFEKELVDFLVIDDVYLVRILSEFTKHYLLYLSTSYVESASSICLYYMNLHLSKYTPPVQ